MKKMIFTILISLAVNCFCFGQVPMKTVQQDSEFIEVYVDKKGNIFLDAEKTSLLKLENFLKKTELREAKFATVFPTPMKVFATVERVNNLFKKFGVEAKWYKDPEFSIPAWEYMKEGEKQQVPAKPIVHKRTIAEPL